MLQMCVSVTSPLVSGCQREPSSELKFQNTSAEMDPAEYTHLQVVTAWQGAIILTYQEQLAALQTANELPQQPTLTQGTPSPGHCPHAL